MKSTLVYSFRTTKFLDEFKKAGFEVFVFGKLKEDLIKFQILIDKLQPKHIIGLAEVKTQSRLETLAVNRLGRKGKVNRTGKDYYPMYTQTPAPFPISKRPTNSFCNWTMYKVSEIVSTRQIALSFVHFNRSDLEKVLHFVKSMR